jgi:hypothetical protein
MTIFIFNSLIFEFQYRNIVIYEVPPFAFIREYGVTHLRAK